MCACNFVGAFSLSNYQNGCLNSLCDAIIGLKCMAPMSLLCHPLPCDALTYIIVTAEVRLPDAV